MATTAAGLSQSTPPASPTMGRVRAIVAMTRPAQVGLIVAIGVNGLLLALWRAPQAAASPGTVAASLLLVVLVAMSAHLANEAADHETDRLSRRTPFSGGSGALAASGVSPGVPLMISLSIAAIVSLATLGAILAGLLPPLAGVLLWLGLAGALAYSLPPVAAMRRGWGEPLNTLLGGLLLPLFMLSAASGTLAKIDVLAFAPFCLVVLASVMATAWPDRTTDAASGKATMQVRFAPAALRRIHAVASMGFVVVTVVSAAAMAMPLALVGLLVTPWLIMGMARYTQAESPLANVSAMVGLTLITTVTLSLSLWSGIDAA